ncbi:MAG: flagellin [Synergistaceae bacterium]|nr:flagellin [Synergistaceae bacterium]
MMMVGNNNIMLAYNSLTATNKAIENTARALSTGKRTATAADDASGLAMSLNISSQLSGVDRAIRNAQDGVSMLQVAEGALDQINSMLQRMRELSVQAANDTLTTQDRNYIQLEIAELRENINNVAKNTTFNCKRLLDGSSGASWTSDKAATQVKIAGSLTTIDQFGQKNTAEGNYRIEVKARPGQAEVLKTGIFTIPDINDGDSENEYTFTINIEDGEDINGATSGHGWEFKDGALNITGSGKYHIQGTGSTTDTKIVVNQGVDAQIRLTDVNISADSGSAFEINGANVKLFLAGDNSLTAGTGESAGLEVQNVNGYTGSLVINSCEGTGSEEGTLTATGSGCGAGIGGACHNADSWKGSVGAITINGGTITAEASQNGAGIGGGGYYNRYNDEGAHVQITINGGNITATGSGSGAGIGSGGEARGDSSNVDFIIINGGKINATGSGGAAAIGGGNGSNGGSIEISSNAELTLSGWIDTANGATRSIGRGENGAGSSYVTNTTRNPERLITLQDIPEFYNPSGVFMLEQPQTLTITQGNGKNTQVTLYSTDTIEDVRKKLNNAIAYDLNQSLYTDNPNKFVSFITEEDTSGLESVAGTFVIRSAVAGNEGKLKFTSENEDLLNTLGLNTIQSATENGYTASVYEAHTGKVLAKNIQTDGNTINGIISPNVSIEFDYMANIKATWSDAAKNYVFSADSQAYETTIHIVDKGTAFQIGQNYGEDFYINIGDMTASALGINSVDLTSRKSASQAITIIDAAIHKVSTQRSRVGAYQNELEYNANSLTQTSLQLNAAESRLADTDMAKEYLEFIKLQIISNAGSSMLTQANQNAQNLVNILSL